MQDALNSHGLQPHPTSHGRVASPSDVGEVCPQSSCINITHQHIISKHRLQSSVLQSLRRLDPGCTPHINGAITRPIDPLSSKHKNGIKPTIKFRITHSKGTNRSSESNAHSQGTNRGSESSSHPQGTNRYTIKAKYIFYNKMISYSGIVPHSKPPSKPFAVKQQQTQIQIVTLKFKVLIQHLRVFKGFLQLRDSLGSWPGCLPTIGNGCSHPVG